MHVYHPHEIAEGNVPTRAGIDEVLSILREVLCQPQFMGHIIAGSLADNTYNLLSDIDGIALYDDKQAQEAEKAFQVVVDFSQRNSVPIGDFRLFRRSVAQSHYHGIDEGYWAHLKNCTLISHGNSELLDWFQPCSVDIISTAESYISGKLRKISRDKYWQSYPQTDQWRDLAEEVLNTPFYAAMRVFEALEILPFGHTKQQLMQTVTQNPHRFMALSNTIELLQELNLLRQSTLKSFERACQSTKAIAVYRKHVQQAVDLAPKAEQVLMQLGQYLDSVEQP